MNSKQKLYCAISGYEPNESFSSARNEYYYDLLKKQSEERLKHLEAYVDASNCMEEMESIGERMKAINQSEKYILDDNW